MSRRPGRWATAPVLAVALASPASAAVGGSLALSPDVTVVAGSATARRHDVVVVEPSGETSVRTLPGLPAGADLTAYHDALDGRVLFALDTWAVLGGLPVAPSDVVRFDGAVYDLAFSGAAAGLPAGVGIDAVTLAGDDLLVSFDRAVTLAGASFGRRELVRWDGAGFSPFFDGDAAGLAAGLDLDGVQLLPDGTLLLTFDTAGTVGGVTFTHRDVLSYRPTTGEWQLGFPGAVLGPAWRAAGVDALSTTRGGSVLEIPTLSGWALLAFALLLAAFGARRLDPTAARRPVTGGVGQSGP